MFHSFLGAWLLTYLAHGILGCLPSEFLCYGSGECISGVKYCDGNADCQDTSDEPPGCTNCNRTYYGVLGVKYPLRLSDPVLRRYHHGFVCWLSFVAAGGNKGDVVELTFLSFQIGTFQLESSLCYRGYMEIEDMNTSPIVRKRSIRYSPSSRKKGLRKLNSKVRWDKASSIGSFCGTMIDKAATFYSSGNKVTLTVVLPSPLSGHPSLPRLYLTYRVISRSSIHDTLSYDLGMKVPGAKCDVLLTDCHSRHCVIRSPNFPGFYLRNITCHYWVRQDYALPGQLAQVEVYQTNEFKINLLSGHTNDERYKPGTLTSDCATDVIRVFDGRTPQSPLLAEFCGAGPLPPVRSSGPDLLVQMRSTPFQPLATSRFELDVKIHFEKATAFQRDQCSVTIDGSRNPQGIVRVPAHSLPANTTCSFRISGREPSDRVWLYFAVYHAPDLHPWNPQELCDVSKLEIIHPKPKLRHHHSLSNQKADSVVGTFCEKTSPKQCGHAYDFPDMVPSRPCSIETESYVSTGPEVIIRLSIFKATAVLGSFPHFAARYEIVDKGQAVSPSSCFFRIHSSQGQTGEVQSPHNLFLYGRGGTSDLTCRYEFRGNSNERVRITIQELNFPVSECNTAYHTTNQRFMCVLSQDLTSKFAALNATELWRDLMVPLGCVCTSTQGHVRPRGVVFESIGSRVDLVLTIRNMAPRDDFSTYNFHVSYEFMDASDCDPNGEGVVYGVEGHLVFDTDHATRCRWLLAALPRRALYITVRGQSLTLNCSNRFLFFNRDDQEPFAAFCASETDQTESFFTPSWNENRDVYSYRADLTVLEVIAGELGHFRLHWVEVSRPPEDGEDPSCELVCPELEACISAQLACDGKEQCPLTGEDEAPERCFQFPHLLVVVSTASAVILVFLVVLVVVVRRTSRRKKNKTSIPQRQEDYKGPPNGINVLGQG